MVGRCASMSRWTSLGPIPVFRYVHRANETFREGMLVAADGKTSDDGTALSMTARLGKGGKLLRAVVTSYAEEPVPLASGAKVPARRFYIRGDAQLDLWYDRSETWTAARFVAEDGSEIFYQRI
jgi:hypothetical protein